jgi:hypothetical protein
MHLTTLSEKSDAEADTPDEFNKNVKKQAKVIHAIRH